MSEAEFRPTHIAPRDGLPTWSALDQTQPSARLDALLPVRVEEHRGDWSRIVCSNGWSAWVDGRLLLSIPHEPPVAGRPASGTADPRPLLERTEQALGRYRLLVEELAVGRIDGETFRQQTHGLRIGAVADGDNVWLFDSDHDRWNYCDGAQLRTFATTTEPSVTEGGAPVPAPESRERTSSPAADQATRTGDV